MEFKQIIYEKLSEVARITFNRPDIRNALDSSAKKELMMALDLAEEDLDVKVVVLTGAGDKAFSAGANLDSFKDMSPIEAKKYMTIAKGTTWKIENFSKPVIAAVKGYALGGGFEIVQACDLVIASDDAKFGQPEINVGLIPGAGGTQRLTKAAGDKKSKEFIFTGDTFGVEEALNLGLVNKIVSKDKIDDAVNEVVRKISSKSPLMLKLAKECINRASGSNDVSGFDYESQAFAFCFSTEDMREGVKAFLEKRKANFKGK